MEEGNKKIGKLFSQSAVLTVGTILIAVALVLFKIVFYQKSEVSLYGEFLLAYSLYLFYSIFGYLNVGNPLSNDVYKSRTGKENGIADYLSNAIYLVIFFSFFSSIMLAVNLIILQINWLIILLFCFAMILSNIILVLVSFYRGIEKVFISSVLLIIKGSAKLLILFVLSYFITLTAVNITLAFLLGEILAFTISMVFLFVYLKRNNIAITTFKPNFQMLKKYLMQCIPLVLISFSFQGFNSYVYTLVESQVSEATLGYLDVAITVLSFFIAFFNNIGLMLAANSDRFSDGKGFFKFLFTQVFSITVIITILYEVIAVFITADDTVLGWVFDLDGALLARGVMLILPSFPFLVLFHIISGYKQGKRQYYSISLASILAILISFLPGYFLIKYVALDGALISLIIFAVVLATLVFSMTFNDNFEIRLETFFKKLVTRKKKDDQVNADEEVVENGITAS